MSLAEPLLVFWAKPWGKNKRATTSPGERLAKTVHQGAQAERMASCGFLHVEGTGQPPQGLKVRCHPSTPKRCW